MNTATRFWILAAAVFAAFAFAACGGDDDKGGAPAICECEEKTHLDEGETCNCGTDCDCTLKITGIVSAAGKTIIAWKETGVDQADFDALVAMLNEELGGTRIPATMKLSFRDNINEIRVYPEGTAIHYQTSTLTLIVGSKDTLDLIMPYLLENGIIVV